MKWKAISIGELGDVVTGNTPLTSDRRFYGGKYPFIKPTDMEIDRKHVESWDETYSDIAFEKYKNALIPPGATGVVTIGTVGEKIFQSDQTCFTNQSVNVVIPYESFDADFIYYLLKYNLPKVSSANPGTASGRHHVSKSNFCSIVVNVPESKAEQKEIGRILSAYDDLIENNLRRIKLLEELAQRTYEEWFVRFRFPGHETAVFDEETGLPEGWERKFLFDIAEVTFGYPFKANQFNTKALGTPIIRIRNIPASTTSDFTTEIVDDKYRVNNGDLLVGMDGEFYINNWSGPEAYLVQRSCNIKPKDEILRGYLSQAIVSPIKYYESTISGATVAHLGKKHLEAVQIIIPNDVKLLQGFNSWLDLKLKLSVQNSLLKESREILLPKLMQGKLDVKMLQR